MGRLAGIATKAQKRGPMVEAQAAEVSVEAGIAGDYRGALLKARQVTIMAAEDWADVCADLDAELPWTMRRANLLSEGVALPRDEGARLRVGGCVLEITDETAPCTRMDEQHAGLTAALEPDWRGGRTCRVVAGGPIRVGDTVEVVAG